MDFELPRAKQNQKLLRHKYHCNVNIFNPDKYWIIDFRTQTGNYWKSCGHLKYTVFQLK